MGDEKSIHVIIDHIRSSVFLISEGIVPNNEGKGYVLRRIIRRAMLHGSKIGLNRIFFNELVIILAKEMQEVYPDLMDKILVIENIIKREEEKFFFNLSRGLKLVDNALKISENKILTGKQIFDLYDTFGFPVDIILDIAHTKGFTCDTKKFNLLMDNHKKISKTEYLKKKNSVYYIKSYSKTDFAGYNNYETVSKVLEIYARDKKIFDTKSSVNINENNLSIILDKTPFYAESGGQVGDTGIIFNENFSFRVKDTKKIEKCFLHIGVLEKGIIKVGDIVNATINKNDRFLIMSNHTSTHLLHSSLKTILGKHLEQKGSYLDSKKLRFDFNYEKKIGQEEISNIEDLINQKIRSKLDVNTKIMDIVEVNKLKIQTLFNEKYEKKVRVLFIGKEKNNFSVELCGGTHVSNTSDIKFFKIIKETSIGVGIKRIEAITGETAFNWLDKKNQIIEDILVSLN